MGDGTTMRPYIVRIGRRNHDFGDLRGISVQELAMQYDIQVFNPPQEDGRPQRRHPSRQALHSLTSEACIFLCTITTAGGPLLQRLGVNVSVVIVDEAAQASEQQSVAAIISNARLSQQGRIHAVFVGDQMQLPPVFTSRHEAVKFLETNRHFRFRPRMKRQFESLFERLYRTDRCKTTWLTHHYRSHPRLAVNTLSYMYSDILLHPLPAQRFERPYNNLEGENGLQCLTVIDTRLSLDRFESDLQGASAKGGRMYNTLEMEIANRVAYRIYNNRGDADMSHAFQMASPYQEMTNLMDDYMHTSPRFCSRHPNAPDLVVTIDTTDALQGTQRSVSIICLTRSNLDGDTGFLNVDNRLNVAFSRAQHLLVVIGDFSTMVNSPIADHIYWSAVNRYGRSSLQFYQPPRTRLDRRQQHEMRRLTA